MSKMLDTELSDNSEIDTPKAKLLKRKSDATIEIGDTESALSTDTSNTETGLKKKKKRPKIEVISPTKDKNETEIVLNGSGNNINNESDVKTEIETPKKHRKKHIRFSPEIDHHSIIKSLYCNGIQNNKEESNTKEPSTKKSKRESSIDCSLSPVKSETYSLNEDSGKMELSQVDLITTAMKSFENHKIKKKKKKKSAFEGNTSIEQEQTNIENNTLLINSNNEGAEKECSHKKKHKKRNSSDASLQDDIAVIEIEESSETLGSKKKKKKKKLKSPEVNNSDTATVDENNLFENYVEESSLIEQIQCNPEIEEIFNLNNEETPNRTNIKKKHKKHKKNEKENSNSDVSLKNRNRKNTESENDDLTRDDLFAVTTEEIEKLKRVQIFLPYPIPLLHRTSTRTSRPSKEEQEKIKSLSLEVKVGPYTKEEDEKIKENWLEFCKVHDLDEHPGPFLQIRRLCSEKMSQLQIQRFLQFLGHGLDNRLLNSIYARFKRLFLSSVIKSGRFSAEEDQLILSYIKNSCSTTFYVDLAMKMNRDRTAIEKRYKYLLTRDIRPKTKWTSELITRFIRKILKVTKCGSIDELKNRQIHFAEWEKISRKMKGIPARKLQRKWNLTLHSRLFTSDVVDTSAVKVRLIKKLYKRKFTDWRAVNWKTMAEKFDGFTADKLYSLFKNLVYKHVPKKYQEDLKECLTFLYEVYLKNVHDPPSKPISKIKFENDIVIEL